MNSIPSTATSELHGRILVSCSVCVKRIRHEGRHTLWPCSQQLAGSTLGVQGRHELWFGKVS